MASLVAYVLLAFCPLLVLFLILLHPLWPLFRSEPHIKLGISPNELTITQISSIVAFLLVKPLLRAVRLVPSLEQDHTNGDNTKPSQAICQLPLLVIETPLVISERDRSRYECATALGAFSGTQSGNPIFLLAGATTPLMLLMLARIASPILPLGAVNVRNRFEFLNPHLCRNVSQLHRCQATAKLSTQGRRVKRGLEVDIVTEVASELEGFNQPVTVFRSTQTVLQFMKTTAEQLAISSAHEQQKLADGHSSRSITTLNIESGAPSAWAQVCKDYNPIHISNAAARVFGFRGKIAHGNLLFARTMVPLMVEEEVFRRLWLNGNEPSWLEVQFQRPVTVPAQLDLCIVTVDSNDGTGSFNLSRESKVCISGAAGLL